MARKIKPLIYVFCEGESEIEYTKYLKEKFEDEYGPLLSKDADSPVQWIKGPWPWEVQ